jgi:hypothetical protein
MREDQFDAYHRHGDSQVPDDFTVVVRFLEDLDRFIQGVFDDPPDVLRGEWLDEQREAWSELRQLPTPLADRLRGLHTTPTESALLDHGLTGRSLRSKMSAWRDGARAFLARRGIQRLARALRTGGVIMESIADAAGFGHAYKEVIKGLHHLTELVIEEGP